MGRFLSRTIQFLFVYRNAKCLVPDSSECENESADPTCAINSHSDRKCTAICQTVLYFQRLLSF